MNIPPDDQTPPSSPNPGLGFDPNAMMPTDVALTNKGGSKMPLIIVGVLLAAGGGYFAYSSKKTREERVAHVKFMEEFRAFENDDLGKFWTCVLGPNTNGAAIPDPNMITAKVDVMFASDFRNYPNKVREECAKAAKDAQQKVLSLGALPEYTAPLEAYGKTIIGMSEALDDWAKVAPEQVQAKMVGKNVDDYGNAYHAFQGGAPTPEVIAYDAFLHCADADVAKHKDNLELAKHLFEQCKDAGYRDRLQNECGKLVTEKPAQPTKDFKAVLGKVSGEDRDVQAFADCLKKARKGKLKDNLAPVGLKWVAFREAREAVLKVGAEVLKGGE